MLILKKIAITLVLGGSAILLSGCNLYQSSPSGDGQTGGQTETSQSLQTGNVVSYSSSGFSPAQIKVKVGEKVEFKNTSGGKIQVNSVPHPTHTSFPELNIGVIDAGQMKSVTLTRVGTYSYHNHLNASQGGTIVVE